MVELVYSIFQYRTANKIAQALIKYFGSRNKKELKLKNFNILLDRMVKSIKE